MYNVTVVTIHPKFIESYFSFGVIGAAHEKGLARVVSLDLRHFAVDKHGTIDDHPYGGGDGMVLRPEPLADAIKSLSDDAYVILTSPNGKIWSRDDAPRILNLKRPIALICGRFGGVDERFIKRYVHEELSVGDFILSGGELPALMMIDAMLRLVPGVLGNEDSAVCDSFSSGCHGILEHPLYTRPQTFEGEDVPVVLLSGNHKKIEEWQRKAAIERTRKYRPSLLNDNTSP